MNDYCIYLRKSRADKEAELRGEGETLSRHESILKELSKKMHLNITKIYKEIVSGETIAARPVVQQLLTEVEQGIWEGVLVMEVERLARGDTIDQGIIAQAFKYSQTKIITPIKIYDPSNEFDEEYFEFGLFMSRREYKTINRRIQRGRIASIKDGKYISSIAPYGYERVKIENDKGYTLRPLPDQAAIVKLIFDLYTKGRSDELGNHEEFGMTKIARYLDTLKIKPLLKDTWSRASIRDILKNPVYIGKICWQRRKEVKQVIQGSIHKSRPNASEYIMVDGLHEAIIDEEVFQKAQSIMTSNLRAPMKPNTKLLNPLSGLVYCKKCNTLMTRLGANKRNKYDTLKCSNRYCDNVSAPIYLVEEQLIEALKMWAKEYSVKVESEWKDEETDLLTITEKAIQSAEQERTQLKKQLTNAYEFLEKGIYSTDVFLERNKALTNRITETTELIEKLKMKYQTSIDRRKAKYELVPAVISILEIYGSAADAAEKNRLLKEVLERAVYIKSERNTRGHLENKNFSLEIYPKLPH